MSRVNNETSRGGGQPKGGGHYGSEHSDVETSNHSHSYEFGSELASERCK